MNNNFQPFEKKFTDQWVFRHERFELTENLPDFRYHYNASMFKCGENIYIILRCHYDKDIRRKDGFWNAQKHSQFYIAKLNKETLQIESYDKLNIPLANCEDPRAVWREDEGRLYVFFTFYDPTQEMLINCSQIRNSPYVAVFDEYFKLLKLQPLVYLKNQQPIEKNWMPFYYKDCWYIVYRVYPALQILKCNEYFQCTLWHYGEIPFRYQRNMILRGGTPPLLIDGIFYGWYHSTSYSPYVGRGMHLYAAGMYAFNMEEGNMTGLSNLPIIMPNLHDKFWGNQTNSVVFPAGSIYNAEERTWLISYGYQDATTRIEKIWMDDLFLEGAWMNFTIELPDVDHLKINKVDY